MPSLEYLLPFFVATVLFAYMPGPALLYTAAQTLARGRRAGFMAALGLHLGGYVHVTAAALGLSAIFTHVPELYTLVKLLGAGYLVWLGICFIRQRDTVEQLPQVKARSAWRAFLQSITVEVLNPKTVIFFIAFLPQFADASASFPLWVQLLLLGTFVNLAVTTADIVAVLLTDRVLRSMRRSVRAVRLTRIIGGGILVALGARLALAED
jgi:threonine/homoserine/homoserine lactone efflux protein